MLSRLNIFLFAAIALCSFNVAAQQEVEKKDYPVLNRTKPETRSSKVIVGISAGLMPTFLGAGQQTKPVLQAEVAYQLLEKMALGLYYAQGESQGSAFVDVNNVSSTKTIGFRNIGTFISGHFFKRNNFGLYGGVAVGYKFFQVQDDIVFPENTQFENKDAYLKQRIDPFGDNGKSKISFGGFLGAEYQVVNRVYITSEIGNSNALFNFGVKVKL